MKLTSSTGYRNALALCFSAGLLLTGCSSVPLSGPTPYKEASTERQYGYSSVQLSDVEYRVMFRATEATDAALVQEYTLFRAAEIAKDNHFPYLAIVKSDVERKSTTGKRLVKGPGTASPIPVLRESQCTMSGCDEVGRQFPSQSDELTIEEMTMKDVYYSILVRMGNNPETLGQKSFEVEQLLSKKPG